VYKPGSTSPAAQLLDARDLYDAGSARADKLLRQMSGHLAEAVEGCAAAAGGQTGVSNCWFSVGVPAGTMAYTSDMPSYAMHVP
jgi:hypothetical protein